MGIAVSVCAIRAPAMGTTFHTSIETLTVLLLALSLPAVAALSLLTSTRLRQQTLLSLLAVLLVVLVIETPLTAAIFSTTLAFSEALAIHFEALGLLASAASFLFFDGGGSGYGVFGLQGVFDGELIFQVGEGELVDADNAGEGQAFVGLDELHGVVEVWQFWYVKETVPVQIHLTHVLYTSLSVKYIILPLLYLALNTQAQRIKGSFLIYQHFLQSYRSHLLRVFSGQILIFKTKLSTF